MIEASLDKPPRVKAEDRASAANSQRERLRGLGSAAMSDDELVALVIGHGVRGAPLAKTARRVLCDCGGVAGLGQVEVSELETIRGLGPALAARLLAAVEIGRRIWRPRAEIGDQLVSSCDAARHFDGLLRDALREEFHVLLLDTRHRVIGTRLVSVGTLQSSLVHPREVFRPAIRVAAAAIVVGHNHPSGDPTPSIEDERVTERLRESGQVLGIELLDHVVLGRNEYWSFAEARCARLPRLSTPHAS